MTNGESCGNDDDGRYRLLVDAITDYAIYMLDPSGLVTSWNPGARRFKGYEAAEIVGRHFSVFYTPEERMAGVPETALRTAAETGLFEREGWRVRKDGSRFWAHVVIDPIRDPAGGLLGYAKITRDLTERRAAEEAVAERRRLREAGGEPDAVDDVAARHLCVICLEREHDAVFRDCGHLAACSQCASKLVKCPICRGAGPVIRVYRA